MEFYKARKIAFEKVKRMVRGNVPEQTIILTIQTEFGFGKRLINQLIQDAKELGFAGETKAVPKEIERVIDQILNAEIIPKETKAKSKKGAKK